jgi:hypothetical protein
MIQLRRNGNSLSNVRTAEVCLSLCFLYQASKGVSMLLELVLHLVCLVNVDGFTSPSSAINLSHVLERFATVPVE